MKLAVVAVKGSVSFAETFASTGLSPVFCKSSRPFEAMASSGSPAAEGRSVLSPPRPSSASSPTRLWDTGSGVDETVDEAASEAVGRRLDEDDLRPRFRPPADSCGWLLSKVSPFTAV